MKIETFYQRDGVHNLKFDFLQPFLQILKNSPAAHIQQRMIIDSYFCVMAPFQNYD